MRDEGASDGRGNSVTDKAPDAAVRCALIEARHEFLVFLRQRLGSSEEAQEVLQRFSLRALERAWQLRDTETVRGWLRKVLASTLADHQRKSVRKRRREVAIEDVPIESLAEWRDPALDAAVCGCLHRLLPTLKPEYADIVWRADLLGEPRDRIAIQLGTTANNVTVRLHRGRQALRKRLEELCLTCPAHGFLDCRCENTARSQVPPPSGRQRKRA
jgi:RNA polymerase sigma-70 factor (ECF subfamily)